MPEKLKNQVILTKNLNIQLKFPPKSQKVLHRTNYQDLAGSTAAGCGGGAIGTGRLAIEEPIRVQQRSRAIDGCCRSVARDRGGSMVGYRGGNPKGKT